MPFSQRLALHQPAAQLLDALDIAPVCGSLRIDVIERFPSYHQVMARRKPRFISSYSHALARRYTSRTDRHSALWQARSRVGLQDGPHRPRADRQGIHRGRFSRWVTGCQTFSSVLRDGDGNQREYRSAALSIRSSEQEPARREVGCTPERRFGRTVGTA